MRADRLLNRRLPFLAAVALAGSFVALAVGGRDFAGIYQTTNEVESGDSVSLTFTTEISNYSGADIEISLPFRLTPEVTISYTTNTTSKNIAVQDGLNYQVASAKLMLDVDRSGATDDMCMATPPLLDSLSSPLFELELHFGSGLREVVGTYGLGPSTTDWSKIDDTHRRKKP